MVCVHCFWPESNKILLSSPQKFLGDISNYIIDLKNRLYKPYSPILFFIYYFFTSSHSNIKTNAVFWRGVSFVGEREII